MPVVLVIVIVALVLFGVRYLNSLSSPRRSRANMRQRTDLEAREALANLRAPENTIAGSSVRRPLGVDFGGPAGIGVLVTAVHAGSPAARVGIEPGAVLTGIGDRSTTDAEFAHRALGEQVAGLGVRLRWINPDGNPHDDHVIL